MFLKNINYKKGTLVKSKCLPLSAIATAKWRFSRVPPLVFSEMWWMSEFLAAILAGKSRLILVNKQVVLEAVPPGEYCSANTTLVGLDARVAAIMWNKGCRSCETTRWLANGALQQVIRWISVLLHLLDQLHGHLLFLFARTWTSNFLHCVNSCFNIPI